MNEQLIEILTKSDVDEVDNSKEDLNYVIDVLKKTQDTKILRLGIQSFEKCCTRMPSLVTMEALSILYNLMDQQSDRSVKIVISQTISRIARLCHDNAKAHIEQVEKLLKANGADNVICRSLREALDYYVKISSRDEEQVKHHAEDVTAEPNGHDNEEDREEEGIVEEHISRTVKYDHEEEYVDYEENDPYEDSRDNNSQYSQDRKKEDRDDEKTSHDYEHFKMRTEHPLGLILEDIFRTKNYEDLLDHLSRDEASALTAMVKTLTIVRWRELNGRLQKFHRPNYTTPAVIEKHMRLNPIQVSSLIMISGFKCSHHNFISVEDYNKILSIIKVFASLDNADYDDIQDFVLTKLPKLFLEKKNVVYDDWGKVEDGKPREMLEAENNRNRRPRGRDDIRVSDADSSRPARRYDDEGRGYRSPPRGSTSKTYDTGSGAIINSSGQQIHDDATPFLLIQNLPYDVKVEEVLVLLKKYSGCDHLTAQDIIIPRDRSKFKNAKQRMVESSHAFVNFQHIKDARRARTALQGKKFDSNELNVEYSVGKPTNTVWIGGIQPDLTEDAVGRYMRQFGRLKRLDFKQRRSGDAFAFATFEDLNDATLAVKSFQGRKPMIDGSPVRICFSASKDDQPSGPPVEKSDRYVSGSGGSSYRDGAKLPLAPSLGDGPDRDGPLRRDRDYDRHESFDDKYDDRPVARKSRFSAHPPAPDLSLPPKVDSKQGKRYSDSNEDYDTRGSKYPRNPRYDDYGRQDDSYDNYNYPKSQMPPYDKSYDKSYEKPSKPYDKFDRPFEKSYGKPYDKTYEKPYDRSYDKPHDKPYEKPFNKPYEKPYEKPYDRMPPKPIDRDYGRSFDSDRSYQKPYDNRSYQGGQSGRGSDSYDYADYDSRKRNRPSSYDDYPEGQNMRRQRHDDAGYGNIPQRW